MLNRTLFGYLGIVIDIAADILDIDPADIAGQTAFDAIGADQQDMMDIVSELELRLNVELPSELESSRTIAELAAGVSNAIS